MHRKTIRRCAVAASLVLVLGCPLLANENNVSQLEKDAPAPFAGVLISVELFEKYFRAYEQKQKYEEVVALYVDNAEKRELLTGLYHDQIAGLERIADLRQEEIDLVNTKYTAENDRREKLETLFTVTSAVAIVSTSSFLAYLIADLLQQRQ